MSRGTLRSVLPRRSGRRRIPYRKRHRLRLVLNSAHASAAARAKRGAIGYLSSALGAIHRISRLSSQPQCARAILPTTPYERNRDSCCATLPPRPKLCRFTTLNRLGASTTLFGKTKPQVDESVIIGKSRYGRGIPIHRSKPAWFWTNDPIRMASLTRQPKNDPFSSFTCGSKSPAGPWQARRGG